MPNDGVSAVAKASRSKAPMIVLRCIQCGMVWRAVERKQHHLGPAVGSMNCYKAFVDRGLV